MPLHSGLSQHRALSVFPGGQICRGRYPDGPAAILPVCRPFAVQHAAMLLSVFNSKRRPLPPQGRTRPQATPRRAAPRRPCGARAFRPRDAWAHPARRRSQPARGRRPVRGDVRRRRDRAKRRRLVTAARESSTRARRTEENRDKVFVRYACAERKAERRFLTRAAEVVLCGATARSGKRQAACRNGWIDGCIESSPAGRRRRCGLSDAGTMRGPSRPCRRAPQAERRPIQKQQAACISSSSRPCAKRQADGHTRPTAIHKTNENRVDAER